MLLPMKRVIVLSLLLAMSVSFMNAQQRTPPSAEERAKNQTERLNNLLTLSDDQKTKIQTINLELAKKMDEQMGNRGDREAMRAKMQEMDTERTKKYKEVLTDEQFKKYEEDRKKREQEMQNRRGSGPGRRN